MSPISDISEPQCVYCIHFDPDEFCCTLLSNPISDCWEKEHKFFVKKHEFIDKEEMTI